MTQTALPWQTDADTAMTWDDIRIIGNVDGEYFTDSAAPHMTFTHIADVLHDCPEKHANAAFIVKAVNAHAELIELVKDLLDVWDPEWEPGKSLHQRAVAALAKAGAS